MLCMCIHMYSYISRAAKLVYIAGRTLPLQSAGTFLIILGENILFTCIFPGLQWFLIIFLTWLCKSKYRARSSDTGILRLIEFYDKL